MRFKFFLAGLMMISLVHGQQKQAIRVVDKPAERKVDVYFGQSLFTSLLYPDTLEKPVLYPLHAANGTIVTRGFPINTRTGDPTDHPHHIGLWFNFENVNGLDFWNNSFAIPADKKKLYGWIKTDKITATSSGEKGALAYHANWTNEANDLLLEENTRYEFSGSETRRIIDRVTVLKANMQVVFTDAKDGLLGLRVAHELQIPSKADEKYTDDKGNVTIVKGGEDNMATGNYITSEGKSGDAAWSTRAAWCKLYGKMGNDTISVSIIDHPKNPNYPTYWHARGYGLFAPNPLGEKIFTNGKITKNLTLKKGESVTFRFRVVIDDGAESTSGTELNKLTAEFGRK